MVSQHATRKIAIMGGTFDPIHMGHLVTAEAVAHEYAIDEVIFIPTGKPPHKSSMQVTSSEDRYLMTVLGTAANKKFNVSRIEIDREGVTYTIDTVKQLRKEYGNHVDLYFITGADAICQILTWKNSKELLKLVTFIAVTRPGYKKKALIDQIESLREQYDSHICFLEVPALAISSSDIRDRVEKRRTIKYLVSEAVENYIYKHQLYMNEKIYNEDLKQVFIQYVKSQLSPKRFEHTLGVLELAMELGQFYNQNEDQIFIAALFHDLAKELPEQECYEQCKKYDQKIDAFEQENKHLLHGKAAAVILEKQWGIKDPIILDSIRYHTLGRPGMSIIEKIIFLADMLEKGRKPFPKIDSIRALLKQDLNLAMYEALKTSKDYVQNNLDKEIHPMIDVLIEEYKIYKEK